MLCLLSLGSNAFVVLFFQGPLYSTPGSKYSILYTTFSNVNHELKCVSQMFQRLGRISVKQLQASWLSSKFFCRLLSSGCLSGSFDRAHSFSCAPNLPWRPSSLGSLQINTQTYPYPWIDSESYCINSAALINTDDWGRISGHQIVSFNTMKHNQCRDDT